jgi:hypothetical protein
MSAVEFCRRASVSETDETLWRAHDDRLEQIGPDGQLVLTVPYSYVRRVRLAFAPGRMQQTRFLAELTGARSQLTLTSMHFKGIGSFEDRFDTFEPLIRKVVAGVAAANPSAEFRAGERPAYYGLMLVFNILAFGFLALVVLALPISIGDVSMTSLIKLGIVLISLPLMFSWAVNSRPRRFDPARDLDKVLAARSK